jgi:Gylcosyl hydrolase family 115 C-terminal domain
LDVYNQQTRFIDVYDEGDQPFAFTVRSDHPWIAVTPDHGAVSKDQRLLVHIDWNQVPPGENSGAVTISQRSGTTVTVHLVASNSTTPSRKDLQGFVESNHYVSIEAAHFTGRSSEGAAHWTNLPDFGETLSGMTIFPVMAASVLPPHPAASLEYKMYLFEPGTYQVEAILAPTLNFVPGRGLRYAISFDDQPPLIVDALADDTDKVWATAVSDGVRKVRSSVTIAQPGYHTLKFRMVDPGVVLEKLVVSQGEVPSSYLGPPESYHNLRSVESNQP